MRRRGAGEQVADDTILMAHGERHERRRAVAPRQAHQELRVVGRRDVGDDVGLVAVERLAQGVGGRVQADERGVLADAGQDAHDAARDLGDRRLVRAGELDGGVEDEPVQRGDVERAERALAEATQPIGEAGAMVGELLRARVIDGGRREARQRRQHAQLVLRDRLQRRKADAEHADQRVARAHRQAERGADAPAARQLDGGDPVEVRLVERDGAVVDAGEEPVDQGDRQAQRRRVGVLVPADEHPARLVAQVDGAERRAGGAARQREKARQRRVDVAQRREDLRHLFE